MNEILQCVRPLLANRYTVLRPSAVSRNASLFLALDLAQHRPVALKIFHRESGGEAAAETFSRSLAEATTWDHPHLIPVLDTGVVAGLAFVAMPWVEGENLRERLQRRRRLEPAQAVGIAAEIASALAYLRDRGARHRNLRPEKILLSGGRAHLVGAGVADAREEAGWDARPVERRRAARYRAPEAIPGGELEGEDVYALGLVLYEALGGHPAFWDGPREATRRELDHPAPLEFLRPTLGARLPQLVHRAIDLEADARFSDPQEFRSALLLAWPQESTPARAPEAPSPRRSRQAVGQELAWMGVGLLMALFTSLYFALS